MNLDFKKTRPPRDVLVYSCSGCSSAAQMANSIAIRIDREGLARMSCIAGVGGNVPSLVRQAKSAKIIIGIDGCALNCVQHCLKQQGLTSTYHYDLSQMNVLKKHHEDFNTEEMETAYKTISNNLNQAVKQSEAPPKKT